MYTRPLAGLTLSAALLVVGCTQDLAPERSLPTEASLARTPSTSCSFSAARNDAKAYFASSGDLVFGRLETMERAYRAGDVSGTRSAGFAVLARLGAAADAKSTSVVKGTPAQGSTFAHDVLRCMPLAGYSSAADFSLALGATGLFAVRGGDQQAPVVSRGTALLNGSQVPLFGAQKTGSSWHPTVTPPSGERILFYGYERAASEFTSEITAGTSFELKTLPAPLTFDPPINAGVCIFTDASARILHEHNGTDVILAPTELSFCGGQSALGLTSTVSRLASWFLPQPLHAAAAVARGGGGLLSGLSPGVPVTFTAVVNFDTPPAARTSVSADPQFRNVVTVSVKSSKEKTPLKDVTVTLLVIGNNGSYVESGNVETTDASGIARFPDYRISKAGGYTIQATSDAGGSATASFLINGQ